MDRKIFFDGVRKSLFGGKLNQEQVVGMTAILDTWEARKLSDLRWLAYMLATTYHEVGRSMIPVREGFAASDTGARKVVARRKYGKEDPKTGNVYYGRGFVQLTWPANYKIMGKLLGLPLYETPDLALDPVNATEIMFEGMTRGSFTGKKLSTYFTDKLTDWVNARRIINGTDKAAMIAGYGKKFHAALLAAA
jgi:putative chitinase